MKGNLSLLNDVKNRFLSLPISSVAGLEHEPQISDFEFIKKLGIGTFGKVDLVSHKKTKAKYALKYIDKTDPENLEEKVNFNREVEIMYKLNHPNIVKLYGHFEDEKYCYFIMQYIPNRSVYELIPTNGKKPNMKLIASVIKDVINAVYYLHNMKPTIIHRDIKPENVLLDQKTKAYLTDFGWSNYAPNFMRRNTVCGSPLYLPPEMVKGSSHDKTADIWCIGVLLFELTTGKPPFAGDDMETVARNIIKLNISWPPQMDPDAKDLISKILKLNGKERLPLEQILTHKFFSKFFPNATKELIKPENQKNKIYIVSVDTPNIFDKSSKPPALSARPITNKTSRKIKENKVTEKNYERKNNNSINKDNKNINNFKKVYTINDNKSKILRKNKSIHIPTVNIDLTNSRKDINNKKIIYNKTPSNNSYNQKFIKPGLNPSNSFFKNNNYNGIYNSYRNSINNNQQIYSNKRRYTYKSPNITDYNIIKNNNSNNNYKADNKAINKTHVKVISDIDPSKYVRNYHINDNNNYNKYSSKDFNKYNSKDYNNSNYMNNNRINNHSIYSSHFNYNY